MEISYNVNAVRAASYKMFKWEGDIDEARKHIGENTSIEIHQSRKEYVSKYDAWARGYVNTQLDQRGIKEGMPFVIINAYYPVYFILKEGDWFAYGWFPFYNGSVTERWNVLAPEELTAYYSAKSICALIERRENAK